MTRRPGCLGGVFIGLFLAGGIVVLILQSAASTGPTASHEHDDLGSLASLVTVVWIIVLIVVAVAWLLAIIRRPDDEI